MLSITHLLLACLIAAADAVGEAMISVDGDVDELDGHETLPLALEARCSFQSPTEQAHIECAAAHYPPGTSPTLRARGAVGWLDPADGCGGGDTATMDDVKEDVRPIALAVRGGCSFLEKALTAQRRQRAALLIIDHTPDDSGVVKPIPPPPPQPQPQPPSLLGGEPGTAAVTIPVAMVTHAAAAALRDVADAGAAAARANAAVAVAAVATIELRPLDAGALWELSPWYSAGADSEAALRARYGPAADGGGRRVAVHAPTCDPAAAGRSGGDDWLYRRWLSVLADGADLIDGTDHANGTDSTDACTPLLALQPSWSSCGEARASTDADASSNDDDEEDGGGDFGGGDACVAQTLRAAMEAVSAASSPDDGGDAVAAEPHALVRLAQFDVSEPYALPDPILLNPLSDLLSLSDGGDGSGGDGADGSAVRQRALQALNSQSHVFPWGGRNRYAKESKVGGA